MPARQSFTSHEPVASASPNFKICCSEWLGSFRCLYFLQPAAWYSSPCKRLIDEMEDCSIETRTSPFVWPCEVSSCCLTRKCVSTTIPPKTKFASLIIINNCCIITKILSPVLLRVSNTTLRPQQCQQYPPPILFLAVECNNDFMVLQWASVQQYTLTNLFSPQSNS
jgi:hypothetical protein